MRSAQDLLDELNAVDESTRIEAKRASQLGKSVMETVIAYANEPGLDGGYLLLGVDWATNDKGDTVYTPTGLPDPDITEVGYTRLPTLTTRRVTRDKGLLRKQGGGNRTYYTLAQSGDQPQELATLGATLSTEHATLPPELATLLATLGGRTDSKALRNAVLKLCAWQPLTAEQLATLLNKDHGYLRNKHLTPMVKEGLLQFLYPETAKHPHQAYKAAPSKGKEG